MESAEIRTRFLKYFADNGHEIVPSASLLLDDPTLLFVNAGMVPFAVFPRKRRRRIPARRARRKSCAPWTSKRSARLRVTRRSSRWRATFRSVTISRKGRFPSRGSCSPPVADGGYGFDESRLWVMVYLDDDEAIDIWHRDVGLPLDRIQRRGQADNYWSMENRAVRTLLEIYDRGPDYGAREVLLPTRTATSKCGTWFSCNSSEVPVRQKRTTPS